MFGFKKKDEDAVEAAAPEAAPEVAPEVAPESSPEQVVDQRNSAILQTQLQLAQLRENAVRQEQQLLLSLAEARKALNEAVRKLAASRGIDVDDGSRWNFDIATKEFSQLS
jgi:pyruvate/2-oxoglutarate dehydrogenase complex dihydrolipoamide acyltransferase (E2) component